MKEFVREATQKKKKGQFILYLMTPFKKAWKHVIKFVFTQKSI